MSEQFYKTILDLKVESRTIDDQYEKLWIYIMKAVRFFALLSVFWGIFFAAHANQAYPILAKSTQRDCELILESVDLHGIEVADQKVEFQWSGECKAGYAHGEGRLAILVGGLINDIQHFGPNSGVTVNNGIVEISKYRTSEITKYQILEDRPNLMHGKRVGCSIKKLNQHGYIFNGDVNLDSLRFLRSFLEDFESHINRKCRFKPNLTERISSTLRTAKFCGFQSTCSITYDKHIFFELSTSSEGYADLTLLLATSNFPRPHGKPDGSRYAAEIHQLNLPLRRELNERAKAEKVRRRAQENSAAQAQRRSEEEREKIIALARRNTESIERDRDAKKLAAQMRTDEEEKRAAQALENQRRELLALQERLVTEARLAEERSEEEAERAVQERQQISVRDKLEEQRRQREAQRKADKPQTANDNGSREANFRQEWLLDCLTDVAFAQQVTVALEEHGITTRAMIEDAQNTTEFWALKTISETGYVSGKEIDAKLKPELDRRQRTMRAELTEMGLSAYLHRVFSAAKTCNDQLSESAVDPE